MKKNITNWILLIAVLILWGAIGYKVYSYFYKKDNPVAFESSETLPPNYFDGKKLSKNNRDPFLNRGTIKNDLSENKSIVRPASNSSNQPKSQNVDKKVVSNSDIESLKYLGMIKNRDTGEKIAMIKYKGKIYKKKTNEKLDVDIKIVSFEVSSMKVSHKNKTHILSFVNVK